MERRRFVKSSALAATCAALAPGVSEAKKRDPRKMRDKIVGTYKEPEITSPVWLCDDSGNLNPDAVGWSRTPVHRFNLKGNFARKKRWHYWNVTTDSFLFSFTVSDADIAGVNFAYFLDYNTKELLEKQVVTPFGRGVVLPNAVEGSAAFEHRAMPFTLNHKGKFIEVHFSCPKLGSKPVEAELVIHKPENHETLSVVIPWTSERFQYTSKHNTLPTEGVVKVDGKSFVFDKSKSWATLDFGRGVWPYNTAWNWGTFSGAQDGDVIGINIGGKWTDGTGTNENGICHNGKLYKISEDLLWEYNIRDFMEPWRIKTQYSDMLDLTFTPFYDKYGKTNVGVIKTEVHQCFGHYKGAMRFDGKTVEVKNLMGWAEEHIARW